MPQQRRKRNSAVSCVVDGNQVRKSLFGWLLTRPASLVTRRALVLLCLFSSLSSPLVFSSSSLCVIFFRQPVRLFGFGLVVIFSIRIHSASAKLSAFARFRILGVVGLFVWGDLV